MTDQIAAFDPNNRTSLLGVDSVAFTDTTTVAVNPTTHAVLVDIVTDSVGIGGGTQYAEGVTAATITGTAILWEDTSDTLKTVSAASPLPVGGNIADNGVDSGNPVKVGAKYNSTLPTYADGDRGDLQIGNRGSLHVEIFSPGTATGATVIDPSSDSQASSNSLRTASFPFVYNGSNWDRARGNTSGSFVQGAVASDAADSGNPVKVGGVYTTSQPTLTTGDRADFQTDSRGNHKVTLFGNNSVTSVSLTNPTTDAISSQPGIWTDTQNLLYNGSTWDRMRSGGVTGYVGISGDTAHDEADAGYPVKIGAQARTTNPTAVADSDRVSLIADDVGRQVVVGSVRDLKVSQITTITSSTSETTVITAGASGVFHDVYGVIVTNTSATDTEVTFKDSTTGTTRFIISAPANDTRGFMLQESAAHNQATAANNWTATCADSVASIVITMLAVKNV